MSCENHEHHEHEHSCHCHEHNDGCGCGHDHGEKKANTGKTVAKYVIGALPIIAAFLPFIPTPVRIVLALLAYAVFGFEVWRDMIRGFAKRRIFTEFTLMCVASVGAIAIGELADAAAVVYLYSLGEALSDGAYRRSKKSISDLVAVTPEYATVIRDGSTVRVTPEEVEINEILVVNAGERVPVDGEITEGSADADTSSITGEAVPMALYAGVACPSGAVLVNGSVKMRATARYENSVAARLEKAVKEASGRKARAEKKIARFARVFTPAAFAVAALVTIIGTAVTGEFVSFLKAGLCVLVVSCPCSLVLSVPLTYLAGVGAVAKTGVVFKGGEVMDSLCRVKGAVFDKTGTLTDSNISFDGAQCFDGYEREEFLSLARDVLSHSPHAAAVSFCDIYKSEEKHEIKNAEIIAGRGVICEADGKRALFGNAALMRENGIDIEDSKTTAIFGVIDGRLVGRLDFSSHLKKDTRKAIDELKSLGVTRIATISGDAETSVERAAKEAGIDEYYASVTPDAKADILERIQNEIKSENKNAAVLYCGDGLNDSAVIAMADVGVAMGESGAALTVESADMVLVDDKLTRIATAIRSAKRTSRIATENIVLSLGIKIAVLAAGVALSALGGEMPLELAIVADVGAAIVAVLNAMRAAKIRG